MTNVIFKVYDTDIIIKLIAMKYEAYYQNIKGFRS